MARRNRWKPLRNGKAPLSFHLPTAESLEVVEKQKLVDFSSFVEYYRTVPHLGFEKAFHVWWVFKGPTGFYKTTDTAQYKKELRSYISTKLEAAGVENEQTHTG